MRLQKTSKLFLVVLKLFITLFLSSCNILDNTEYFYSEEEKQKFVQYFKAHDEIQNGYGVTISIGYPIKKGDKFNECFLYYSYLENEDGTIVVRGKNSYKSNSFFEYIYENKVLTINELERLTYGGDKTIIYTQETKITKEEFLNTYRLDELFKYNIDFSQAEYYKTRSRDMHHFFDDYHFNFDENYKLYLNIGDVKLVLSNIRCCMSYIDDNPRFNYNDSISFKYIIDGIECSGYWDINKGERER